MRDDAADVSKAPARISGMFDAIAGRYDFLNHVLSAGVDRRWRRRAIASLRLTGRERVLDLCTGTADLAIDAMRAHPQAARVIGVDFAAAMLALGRRKVSAERLAAAIALVRGDAMRIPLGDASVDAVTIAFGIRNVADVAAACREMQRVLRPGGRLAILEFSVPTMPVFRECYMWYVRHVLPRIGRAISRHDEAYTYLQASIEAFLTPAEFVTILRQAGFVDVRAVQLMLGSVFLYEARRRPADILVLSP
ncbi:MAG TPA: bifunctional demethylmenaquinone methyltransferase/2-methoxy-6-polyprenyl-1,4-benzoquinol methylase UbiE [Vicinamibacterales bacterium]|nr:bifunctional demethylmenaquinone methyltransferase/2-methoxy-6-polyprenyl-1,4-benzoquinol methylase UbiE [Vicinamibacterales bacterium]